MMLSLRFGHEGEVGLSARVSTRIVGLSAGAQGAQLASSACSGSAAWPGSLPDRLHARLERLDALVDLLV